MLDAAERRLYLLAHRRPPAEPGRTLCTVPPQLRRLMDDLPARPAYILNLRWDVVAWNAAADKVFRYSAQAPGRRNLLWMLFVDPHARSSSIGSAGAAHAVAFAAASPAPPMCPTSLSWSRAGARVAGLQDVVARTTCTVPAWACAA